MSASIEWRLLGREGVRRRLGDVLERAAAGVGCVVVVAGEAGMGKTALSDAVLVDAKREGWRVAWAAAPQASTIPGLWGAGAGLRRCRRMG